MSDLPSMEPLYGALSFGRPEIWVNKRISDRRRPIVARRTPPCPRTLIAIVRSLGQQHAQVATTFKATERFVAPVSLIPDAIASISSTRRLLRPYSVGVP